MEKTEKRVTEITYKNINDITDFNKNPELIIQFWSPGCPISNEVLIHLMDINKEVPQKISICDVNKNPGFANAAGIREIPTVVLIKNGNEINRLSGPIPKDDLKDKIENGFGKEIKNDKDCKNGKD